MTGSTIKRKLETREHTYIITYSHSELGLTNQQAVNTFFETEKPKYIFLAVAKVGGILVNTHKNRVI